MAGATARGTLFCIYICAVTCATLPLQQAHGGASILNHPLFSGFLPKGEGKGLREMTAALPLPKNEDQGVRPLIIIPSLIGNRIEAKLQRADTIHWYCFDNADWYTIWLDTQQFYPYEQDCFIANFKMKRDSATSLYGPQRRGVYTRVPGWGRTETSDYLDTNKKMPIWKGITDVLRALGYQDGVSLRAAPYEWRAGPDGLASYFADLKQLFEETYALNGNRSAVAASLSMGGPYFVIFLSTVSQEWKDKYIYSFVSFSGAFGGSSAALGTFTQKMNQYGPVSAVVKQLAETWGSIAFLLPDPSIFGKKVFLTLGNKKYTAGDFPQLFTDLNSTTQLKETVAAVKPYQEMKPPGVRTVCVFGYGVQTTATFKQNSLSSNATVGMEDGDGTCLTQGLSSCESWAKQQKQAVIVYPVFNMTHASEVRTPQTIRLLLKELGI